MGEKIADSRVLSLIGKFLKQGVMETGKDWQPTPGGTPQGALMSPLLANIYLDPLDHLMAGKGRQMIRYADELMLRAPALRTPSGLPCGSLSRPSPRTRLLILCESREEAEAALQEVKEWMQEQGLTLHPEKTRIVDARQRGGFEFLGWHFERGMRWPREKSQTRFKESIRKQTRRSEGRSMKAIIAGVNRTVRGWGNYFQGGVSTVSPKLESWLRMRLRSILRHRDKRDGRGRGRDHNRYPNAWFAERGLISLKSITQGSAISPAK